MDEKLAVIDSSDCRSKQILVVFTVCLLHDLESKTYAITLGSQHVSAVVGVVSVCKAKIVSRLCDSLFP